MPVVTPGVLTHLGIALAIGLLIGLERGWERREGPEGSRVAGFRTFGLISLLGGIVPTLAWGPARGALIAVIALVLGGALTAGYWRESAGESEVSLTTTIAGLIAYLLGVMAGSGAPAPAASAAVVVTLILGFKPELHELLRRIDRAELLATLRLLLISIVLLPVLPNRGFGPWQALNPYRIWWMVVLVAGISYVGYFASRLFGEGRGVLVTGILGGLASSTAVALEFSRREEREPEEVNLIAAAIVAGSAIMFPRVWLILAGLRSALAVPLLAPLGAAAFLGLLVAGVMAWRGYGRALEHSHIEHDNPLDLATALKFGATIALLMLIARAAQSWMGDHGLYLFAALDGLVDVDALTLSVASMVAGGQVVPLVAANAIMIVATVNTLAKLGITIFIAGEALGLRVGIGMAAMIALAALVFWRINGA